MNISNVKRYCQPFTYYTFINFFDENDLHNIKNIKLESEQNVLIGKRSTSKVRKFLSYDGIEIEKDVLNFFKESNTIKFFENVGNVKIKDSYLRIELVCDLDGSWLEPHVDIKEKLMSLLIYINDSNEDVNLGTDLYDGHMKRIKTVPYIDNTGFFFYPSEYTWHGLEPKKIKTHRKALMVNYVTFETDIKV